MAERDSSIAPPAAGPEVGPRLWRSVEALDDSPELEAYLAAEFPDMAKAGTVDRRSWLRFMGASLALAGMSACRSESVPGESPLLSPVAKAPGHVPGTPLWFATTLDLAGYGRGLLVKTQEGRPIKIEGNPLHPASLGATDVFAQAEVLSLYDPDRSRAPTENGLERTWDDLDRIVRSLRDDLAAGGGRGLHILLPTIASPTIERLIEAARGVLPRARWHRHSPIADDSRRAGAIMAFGRPVDLIPDLRNTDVVVTLGGDLFSSEPGHVRLAADYQARRRDSSRPLPRLIAVESTPSLVGARADERISLRPRDMEGFARDLASSLIEGLSAGGEIHPAAARLAADLRRAGPRGLVTVGREQPAYLHALAHAINKRLGAFGQTVRAVDPICPIAGDGETIEDLATAISAGDVTRLLVLGANPAYEVPADLDLERLIGRVPFSLHLGYHRDETAATCLWHAPQCHGLEAFGDLHAFDGTVGFRQPATVRLRASISLEETLSRLFGRGSDGREVLAETWRGAWGGEFDGRFARALEDGVVPDTQAATIQVGLRDDWDRGPTATASPPYDILFTPDPTLWDGRYANNAWLQELPRPLTKQVWGNAALIAPETAAALGIQTGDLLEIACDGRRLAAAAWILPGQAPGTVTLPLGSGRRRAGSVGSGVGFDAYQVRPRRSQWITAGEVRRTGARADLVSTQHHHALPNDRIVRVVTPQRLDSGNPATTRPSLYPEPVASGKAKGYAWGMAIDLDACIGCNACVIACQAENNVAVAGPEQVARGREMHWLRLDRYYAGTPALPETFFQPVPCMHCEQAPCEVVCPVNATVHSSEGLNDMVYGRCIGTRTCSNNCPYKVRRFNFSDGRAGDYATPDDVLNPHVAIRERGVMEKCTYCVQRIGAARATAGVEERAIREGEIVTACQQACPTQAIVFGNVNDPESSVSRLKRSPRNYALLGELNTKPRTTYLARIEPDERAGGERP